MAYYPGGYPMPMQPQPIIIQAPAPAPAPQQQQQQQQQSSVVVIGGNGGDKKKEDKKKKDTVKLRPWHTDICSCCDDSGSCIMAFCCPICFSCMLASQMQECAFGPSLLWSCGFCAGLRTKVRLFYDIDGSVLEDLCMGIFCPMCIMAQMSRELTREGYKAFYVWD